MVHSKRIFPIILQVFFFWSNPVPPQPSPRNFGEILFFFCCFLFCSRGWNLCPLFMRAFFKCFPCERLFEVHVVFCRQKRILVFMFPPLPSPNNSFLYKQQTAYTYKHNCRIALFFLMRSQMAPSFWVILDLRGHCVHGFGSWRVVAPAPLFQHFLFCTHTATANRSIFKRMAF